MPTPIPSDYRGAIWPAGPAGAADAQDRRGPRSSHLAPPAVDANWIARGLVLLGLAGLAFSYATVALRSAGVLRQSVGLSQLAGVIAALTVDLWISSAILLLGAVSHLTLSRLRFQPSAA